MVQNFCSPLSVNFWDRHRARFLEKYPESLLVTSQLALRRWKLYVQIECQLGFNMMLMKNGICQYEGRYAELNKNICHFLGPWPSVFSGKKIQSTETYTNRLNAALWIFFGKHARWRSHVSDFQGLAAITIFCITNINHLKRNPKISFGSKSSIF